ncbi:hypothetical protein P8452_65902 [Trifolium repens]|nr:hypothetical protein P8452_65902 [Trifolium repens]
MKRRNCSICSRLFLMWRWWENDYAGFKSFYIQDKIKWADSMSEIDKKHRKDVEEKVDEVKKSPFKLLVILDDWEGIQALLVQLILNQRIFFAF